MGGARGELWVRDGYDRGCLPDPSGRQDRLEMALAFENWLPRAGLKIIVRKRGIVAKRRGLQLGVFVCQGCGACFYKRVRGGGANSLAESFQVGLPGDLPKVPVHILSTSSRRGGALKVHNSRYFSALGGAQDFPGS